MQLVPFNGQLDPPKGMVPFSGKLDAAPEETTSDLAPAEKTLEAIGQVYPAAEAGANIATQMVAVPISGLAGAATAVGNTLGLTDEKPADVIAKTADTLTYKPQTELGQHLTNAAMYPLRKLGEVADVAGEKTADVTGSPAAGAVVNTAIQMAPSLVGLDIKGKMKPFSGDLDKPRVEEAAPDGKPIVEGEHVPYAAGTDAANTKVYVDKAIPQFLNIGGKPVDVHQFIAVHEETEKPLMDQGLSYQQAHQQATAAEKAAVEGAGINWKQYSDTLQPYITRAAHEKDPNIPHDLETKPYVDEGQTSMLQPRFASLPASEKIKTILQGDGPKPADVPAPSPEMPKGIVYMHMGIPPAEAWAALKETPLAKSAIDTADKGVMFVSPMATAEASDAARAAAKDFANATRYVTWRQGTFDDILNKHFTRDEQQAMWEAQAEQSVLEQQGLPAAGKGLDRLNDEQRATVQALNQYGQSVWDRAQKAGIVQGEGLPSYAPYMFVKVGEDGAVARIPAGEGARPLDPIGTNLSTAGPRHRKYLTPEESEAAAQAKLGNDVQIVRNIRTLPMAIARLEKAVAGRELINAIKEQGKAVGDETVTDVEKPGYFTIDHPAFKKYQPRVLRDENGPVVKDGKVQMALDQDGNLIFDKVPLYVRKDFEGPLRAVLTRPPSVIEKALMMLKGKTMSVIMYSPMIHNAVEFGRALPIMRGKILSAYFAGNKLKADPAVMREAINGGLVPIGHRFFNQDITGIAEEPNLNPGRSLTAQALAAPVSLVSKPGAEAVKGAVDKAGNFWHNTLLWDRVADLQMGIYDHVLKQAMAKGMDRPTAVKVAAHEANRFAGALPNESMSRFVRNLANVVEFSRTFTLGNLGVMKDILNGLPRDVASQIRRDAGEIALQAASSFARRKAMTAMVLDIAMFYGMNSVLQDILDHFKRGKSMADIGHGYLERLASLNDRLQNDPFALFQALPYLSSTSVNEPGKEDRILFGYDDNGRAIYMRNPTGKLGEDFVGWLTSPLDMFKRKESTFVRPLSQIVQNDKGFGRRIYNPDDKSVTGMFRAMGNVAQFLMESQVPMESIKGAKELVTGDGDKTVPALKTLGPLAGVTFSVGHPAGPAAGYLYAMNKQREAAIADALPDINDLIRNGQTDEAVKKMQALGMNPREIAYRIRGVQNPTLARSALRKFMRAATPEQRQRFAEMEAEHGR